MTPPAYLVQPPRLAVWLVNLFTRAEEAESILGDLLEEYFQLASKSGVALARSWYWRQTVKTIAQLAGTGFRAHSLISSIPEQLHMSLWYCGSALDRHMPKHMSQRELLSRFAFCTLVSE
jgi:hypothetical protein